MIEDRDVCEVPSIYHAWTSMSRTTIETFYTDSTDTQWYNLNMYLQEILYHARNYKNSIKMYEIALFRHLQLFT